MHYDGYCLLEQFIDGSEWTVGLVDDVPLPQIQIRPGSGFYDYEAKYVDELTAFEFESELPADVLAAIEHAAAHAARVANVSGLTRVDLRLDSYNNPWVLEINSIPGLTDHSLVPKAAERVGLDLGELCEQVCYRVLEQAKLEIPEV